MDNSQRQTSFVKETVWGTTPTAPGWKIGRETRADGAQISNDTRSPERAPHRMAAAMVHGNINYQVSAEFAFMRDVVTDIWLEGLMMKAFSSNTLDNASTIQPFSMEIKHAGGGTNPYRRFQGILVNAAQISWRVGGAGTMSFTGFAKDHTTGTTAIASSTYASPTPGYDPVAPSAITVNSLFGVSAPVITALDISITNNIDPEYGFGSDKPQFMPLGQFDVSGSVSYYLKALADYETFRTRQSGQTLDLTIGSVANFKDQIQLPNCDVWNPTSPDKASRGSDEVTVAFMAKYYAAQTNAIRWLRNVA